jgi:hypothetical protein
MKKAAAELAEAEARKENRGKSKSKTRYMKAAVGANKLRFMPPWTDEGVNANTFYRKVFMHWGVGGDGSKENPGFRFTCNRETPGAPTKDCPICDEMFRLFKTRDPLDRKHAKTLRAKESYVANVVDLNDPSFTLNDIEEWNKDNAGVDCPFGVGETKVKVYQFGLSVINPILAYINNFEVDPTDLDTGSTIIVTRTGTTKENTSYTVNVSPKSEKFTFKGDFSTLAYNLDDLIPFADTEKAKEQLEKGGNADFDPFVLEKGSKGRAASSLNSTTTKVIHTEKGQPPSCFKDPAVHSDTDAECVGGRKNGEMFDRCEFYNECRDAVLQIGKKDKVADLEDQLRSVLG